MDFEIGDRVVSLINDGDGLKKGEFGTVIDVEHTLPIIRWDCFNSIRHSAGNRTENGHGWYISGFDSIEYAQDVPDLGEFAYANYGEAESILLGI